jgi:hypothetical protein
MPQPTPASRFFDDRDFSMHIGGDIEGTLISSRIEIGSDQSAIKSLNFGFEMNRADM